MAWDDAPPTAEELAKVNPSGWDSTPPSEAELALLKKDPSLWEKTKGYAEQAARGTVNALPMLGATVGGIIGTPADLVSGPMGTVAGAGIGAYSGAALKNLINSYIDKKNAPQTMTDVIADPIKEGLTGAALQGVGEVAAPAVSAAGKYVASKLSPMAEKLALKATGATGSQVYNKFPENAGKELLDRGIVGFGDTQANIAQKAQQALDTSGQNIGKNLSELDKTGGRVSKADLLERFNQMLEDTKGRPSQADTRRQLESVIEDVKNGPDNYTLSEAEQEKRAFQDKVRNWAQPEKSPANLAASDVYRNAVEDVATQMNPDLAQQFQTEKQTYGTLAPIAEATGKRASINAQKQSINLGNLGMRGLGALAGGEEGYRHGGITGGLLGAVAGGIVAPRAISSTAATLNTASKILPNLAKATPALTQMTGGDVFKKLNSMDSNQIAAYSDKLKASNDPKDQKLGNMLGVANSSPEKRPAMMFAISQDPDKRDRLNQDLNQSDDQGSSQGGGP